MNLLKINYENLTTDELLDRTKNKDIQARNLLVTQNEKLVHFTIKHYNYTRFKRDYEDIYQHGYIGLITGIQSYSESDRKFALSTYVIYHIRNAIIGNANNYHHITRSWSAINQHKKIKQTKSKLKRKLKHKITPKTLEIETGISVKRQSALHKLNYKTIPFTDSTYDKIGECENRKSHLIKFASNLIHKQRRELEKVEAKIVVEHVFNSKRLNEREKFILRARHGFIDERTIPFREIGEYLNISKERVRQIHIKTLRKLRHPATSKYLNDSISTPIKHKNNRPKFRFVFNDNRHADKKTNRIEENLKPELENLNVMFVGYNSYGYKPYIEATDHPAYKQLTNDLEEYIKLKLKSKPYKITGYMTNTSNLNIVWGNVLQNVKDQQPERIVIQEEELPIIELKDIHLLILVLDPTLKATQSIITQAEKQNVQTIIVTPNRYFK